MSKARNLSDFISDPAIDSTELGDGSVTAAKLGDQAVTPAKLHNTMDLSGKTVTLPTDGISGNSIHGGVISAFASTGIDDNASGTAVTINSSGNVGIGATPQSHYTGYTALDLGASGSIWSNRTTLDTNTIMMANNAYLNSGATNWLRIHEDEATRYEQASGLHRWSYAASGAAGSSISWSEAMRIDSSGNLLVGTTDTAPAVSSTETGIALSPTGYVAASRSGDASGWFNRLSSDGSIINLHKDGSTVGSIGSYSGAGMYAMAPNNGGSGLLFYDNAAPIYPIQNVSGTATISNGVSDLGAAVHRFKDLYLSGGVYLGGTGSANKLDDYEEGNWTPVLENVTVSYTERYGGYTKIGSIVHLYGYMVISSIDNADTSFFNMSGLPFNGAGAYCNGNFTNGTGNPSLFTSAADSAHTEIVSSSYLYLGNLSGTSNLRYSDCCNSSGRFFFHVTYKTDE